VLAPDHNACRHDRDAVSSPVRKLPPDVRRVALRKLVLLDAAESIEDLRVSPGNRLEKLTGERAGQHSIRINDQWRVCFRWKEGDAEDVGIVDYH
jgi:toxin HigB-1